MSAEPQFDGCEVIKKLHSGPVTNWYLARQRTLGRKVVIKALGPSVTTGSRFAASLSREAQLLSSLHHPNIVQLFDFAQKPKSEWMVLEYVDGTTLSELQQRMKQVATPVALAIAAEVLIALDYLHTRGVVHCDLQPVNILVSHNGEVKIANFLVAAEQGYVAAERNDGAGAQLIEGFHGFIDPHYMSPEQVLGERLDARSDLFSLGSTLYEMITGRRPFETEHSRTIAQRIRLDAPTAINRFVDVPASVERLLARALAKVPADRFSSAAEMLQVVQRILESYGESSNCQRIAQAVDGGAVKQSPKRLARSAAEPSRSAEVVKTVAVYVGASCLFLVGAMAIQRWFGTPENDVKLTSGLPLVPNQAAYLRAVVSPWADVIVDGEQVATTPFAAAIVLPAGVHHVKFVHPEALPEERQIQLAPGQTLQLDIALQLRTRARIEPLLDLMAGPADAGAGP
jgi:eukaryotic-like serine/threonine-protein kinase